MGKSSMGFAVLLALLASSHGRAQALGPDGRPIVPGQFPNPPTEGPISPVPGSPEDIEVRRRQEEFTRWRTANFNHDIDLIRTMRVTNPEIEGKAKEKLPPRVLTIQSPRGTDFNSKQWICSKPQDLEAWCGDEDGCTIVANLQHRGENDMVRTMAYQVVMENRRYSENTHPGTYGYTRAIGTKDNEFSWFTGTDSTSVMFSAYSNWAFMLNYLHEYCTVDGRKSPAFKHPYHFSFLTHPAVVSTFIIYD